jgi:hypothetical protein
MMILTSLTVIGAGPVKLKASAGSENASELNDAAVSFISQKTAKK